MDAQTPVETPSPYDATLYNFFDDTKYETTFGGTDNCVIFMLFGNEYTRFSLPVVNLIKMIFDETEITRVLKQYRIDPSKVKTSSWSNGIFLASLSITSSVAVSVCNVLLIDDKKPNIYNRQSFLTMPFVQALIKRSMKNLTYYTYGLNDVYHIQQTYQIIARAKKYPDSFLKYVRIRPLPSECMEYQKILEYVTNSHGPTHNSYKLEVMQIFKVARCGEFMKYKKFRNDYGSPKLLWYGTRTVNYPFILYKGLQEEWFQMPNTGNCFGEGIYFTDIVTKAANKCKVEKTNPYGLLLLAEVALGNTLKTKQIQNISKDLPENKHSVKALGKYTPDPNEHFYTSSGVQVPLGKPIINPNSSKSVINYNEYVVNNPDQILLQYLIKVKFNFK